MEFFNRGGVAVDFIADARNTAKIGAFSISYNSDNYLHSFYISQDRTGEDEYYLIDLVENLDSHLYTGSNVFVAEEIYISKMSLKSDIREQIACFLEQNNFVGSGFRDNIIDSLYPLDISFFEVRYNFYKRCREFVSDDTNLDFIKNFSKIFVRNEDKSITLIEDIELRKFKKNLAFL
jgi:hypothetical protein